MKYGSLFSGIGGFDLGFDRAGMQCAWQVERDKAAASVLAKHWNEVERFDDVCTVGKHNLGAVDVICGGFPCQDLSVAGKRKGLAGERSGLWYEFLRILTELRPGFAVIENVPGLLSSNRGRDFACVIRGLAECGYRVCWRVLDSQYFGVAQRRRRVFIVASLGNGSAAEILFESDGVRWNPPSRNEAGESHPAISGTLAVSGSGLDRPSGQGNQLDFCIPVAAREVAHALACHQVKGGDPTTDNYVAVGIQGDGRTSMSCNGNGISVNDTFTLNTTDLHSVAIANDESNCLTSWDNQRRRIYSAIGTSPTLSQSDGTVGVLPPPVACFDPVNVTSEANRTRVEPGLPANTLHSQAQAVTLKSGVRRLTPVECERLQGFPDGWTYGQSDSARYKQLGNAVTVNVAEWIGRRIMEVA